MVFSENAPKIENEVQLFAANRHHDSHKNNSRGGGSSTYRRRNLWINNTHLKLNAINHGIFSLSLFLSICCYLPQCV